MENNPPVKMIARYNNNGKVTKVTKADGTVENLEYDSNGNLSKYTDEKGNVTVYAYDSMDRLVNIKNANGNSKKVEYTPSGKVSAMVDENGNRTAYKYDALDRMIETDDANRGKTTYVYDAVGNLTEVHQYEGVTSDTLNSMKKDKNSGYSTDLKEIVTKYTYDKRGLLLQETDTANKVVVYTYDANGNLISKTDKDGQTTKYAYDAVNNLSNVTNSDRKQVVYSYNALNDITSMTDWLGTTNYNLDALGRITKVTDYQNKVTEHSYDSVGNKQSIKYPDGSSVSYDYDTMGRLTKVTDGQNKVTTYKYDELGNVVEKLLPNGVKTDVSYDALSKINDMTDYNEKGKVIDNYKYSYDAAGNKIQVDQNKYNDCDNFKKPDDDETEGKTQYKYDALNQLIQITKPDQSIEKYFYDTLGNRIEKEDWKNRRFKDSTDYSYNTQNELVGISGKNVTVAGKQVDKPVTMEYDERGNLTKISSDGKTIAQYTFDSTNEMASATDWLGVVTNYTYDGAGRRVDVQIQLPTPKVDKDGKSKCDKDNKHNNCLSDDIKKQIEDKYEGLLDCPNLKEEYNYTIDQTSPYNNVLMVSGKNETQKYTYGLDVLSVDTTKNSDADTDVSSKVSSQCISNNGTDHSYYLQDDLGSTMKLIDENGKIQQAYSYDAFGTPIKSKGMNCDFKNQSNIFSFTGYQYDQTTGLMYANARYYMPQVGRFISEDSYKGNIADPGSLNRYVYCNSNPLVYIDPSGHMQIEGAGFGYSSDCYDNGSDNQGTGIDVTRVLAKWLIGNPINAYATQQGWFKDLFYAAGFVMDDDGVYHARQDALQQYGGYNFFYDIVFDYATSMKSQPYEFTYDGQDYRFWAWKGDYLNLGAGAELGLYKRLSVFGNQTDHWLVDTSLALPMTLTLNDNNVSLIDYYNPSEPQWWITAFNPYRQNVNAGDLRVTYTIDFSGNKGMFDAFYKQWYGQDALLTFDEENYTATLNF